jgi:hypothetical protein
MNGMNGMNGMNAMGGMGSQGFGGMGMGAGSGGNLNGGNFNPLGIIFQLMSLFSGGFPNGNTNVANGASGTSASSNANGLAGNPLG